MFVSDLSGSTAGSSQPSAISAASAIPRRFWPPSQIGGPPGRTVGGSLVAPTSGTNGSSRVTPGGRRGLGREQRLDRPDGGLEAVEPLRHRRERDADRDVLRFEPAGAEPDDEPPAGDVVQHGRRLGRHGRVAERGGQDGVAEPAPGHVVGEGGHRRHGFPAGAGAVLPDVGQVVVHPDRLEGRLLADPGPDRLQRGPVDGLGRGLDADVERCPSPASALTQVGGHPRARSSRRRSTPNRRGPRTWPSRRRCSSVRAATRRAPAGRVRRRGHRGPGFADRRR